WRVVRPPAVFGPGDHTLRIAAYIQRVADGGPLLVPEETYERPANLAWVKDIGFACALACDLRKAAAHRAYNAAFEDVNLHDLIGGIARALGVEERIHPVPFAELPEGASPYGPHPRRHAGYVNEPGTAALALRFMGAVHRLVLDETLPELARHYPSTGGEGDASATWPAFKRAVVDQRAKLRDLLGAGCQTNEVGRSAALLGGFLEVAHRTHLPLRILEIGASAGLNLRWDRYRYESS